MRPVLQLFTDIGLALAGSRWPAAGPVGRHSP